MAIDPVDPSAQIPGQTEFCYFQTCRKRGTVYIQVDVNGTPELHPRCDDHVLEPYTPGEPFAKEGVPDDAT